MQSCNPSWRIQFLVGILRELAWKRKKAHRQSSWLQNVSSGINFLNRSAISEQASNLTNSHTSWARFLGACVELLLCICLLWTIIVMHYRGNMGLPAELLSHIIAEIEFLVGIPWEMHIPRLKFNSSREFPCEHAAFPREHFNSSWEFPRENFFRDKFNSSWEFP